MISGVLLIVVVAAFIAYGRYRTRQIIQSLPQKLGANIQQTAQGFTYNIGRLVSAVAPCYVGTLADAYGFGTALLICSLAFVLAAVFWIWIPETKGRALT